MPEKIDVYLRSLKTWHQNSLAHCEDVFVALAQCLLMNAAAKVGTGEEMFGPTILPGQHTVPWNSMVVKMSRVFLLQNS